MGDFKDFDLDLKKVKNSTNFAQPNNITLLTTCIPTYISLCCALTVDCPPNSYGGDRGCGPTTSANSRIINK